MKIRNDIMIIAVELEQKLQEQEKFCKKHNYSKPKLIVSVDTHYTNPDAGWVMLGNKKQTIKSNCNSSLYYKRFV